MRYARTITAVVAAGLLTAGCGGDTEDDAASTATPTAAAGAAVDEETGAPADGARPEGEQRPVVVEPPAEEPVRSNPTLSPSPDSGADLTEKIIYELRQRTVEMAGVVKDTEGSCEGGEVTLKAGATTACTITYEGVEVPWEVNIADDYEEGSFIVRYDIAPTKGVLVGETVRAEFWKLQNTMSDDLRCDELPEVELVEIDTDTGYRCQYLIEEDDGPGRYSDRIVKVDDRDVEFDLP
ncbi:hypothetical protein V1J52_10610 [Streptomyces sp. TRM 70351]|uniref:hypothetical protein n=1 Tax=Streptomyces sp. TRM 70351 TaxID=3116552 RepID=UPI002E7AF18E|nr:hypothetical protein [Streptomyces sp. TRM 70351]MEE1928640.1 hypothetical protein [Streptomyces sp. TRM 70351]